MEQGWESVGGKISLCIDDSWSVMSYCAVHHIHHNFAPEYATAQ